MSIRNKAIKGVKWTFINRVFIVLFGLIKISVLTRFLDKSDFGLVAVVLFILELFTLFMNMGITTAILHKQEMSPRQYATLYWFNFAVSVILYLILLGIAPILSNFYNEPELMRLLPIMGTIIIITAIGSQFKTIEKKKLQFKLISIIEIIASFLSVIIAIVMAISNYGVYSLVYSALTLAFISNFAFLFFAIKEGIVKLHFNFVEAIPFLRIGIFDLGGEVINYFTNNIDLILIGKVFGVETLGGYSLAKQLVNRPYAIINPMLTTVADPVLAKYQKNTKQLKIKYLSLVNIIASINIPIYIVIMIFATPIVNILYGTNYESIVVLVRILSIYMILRAIYNPNGSLIVATGKTNLGFYWNMVAFPFIPIAVYVGSLFGIEGVTILLTIITAFLVIPGMWYFLINKLCGATFKEYVVAMIPNPTNISEYLKSYFRNNNINNN